jgi:hypothetical protein
MRTILLFLFVSKPQTTATIPKGMPSSGMNDAPPTTKGRAPRLCLGAADGGWSFMSQLLWTTVYTLFG